jgi:hypothetical protein
LYNRADVDELVKKVPEKNGAGSERSSPAGDDEPMDAEGQEDEDEGSDDNEPVRKKTKREKK